MQPKLTITKRMLLIQGKMRQCCSVQAHVDPGIQAVLEEHFINEPLFKRASYSVNWPKTAVPIPAALTPAMSAYLKNDACPEITVKTMLAGQMHQATNAWEMLCFELTAKLSFDNLLMLVDTAQELDREITFFGSAALSDAAASQQAVASPDAAAFNADALAEVAKLATQSRAA